MMIKRIAVLFAMSIMVKTIYEWSLFIKEESKDTETVLMMLAVEYTIMPLVWDVMPISMIYYLHLCSFDVS